jgi:hypothetical protein
MTNGTQVHHHSIGAKKKESFMFKPKTLAFLKQPEHNKKIQTWRQEIEKRRAKTDGRKPKVISVREAKRCFLRSIQSSRSPYAKDAENLLQQLLPLPRILTYLKDKDAKHIPSPSDSPLKNIQEALRHFQEKRQEKRTQEMACSPGKQKTLLKQQMRVYRDLYQALDMTLMRIGPQNLERVLNHTVDWENNLGQSARDSYQMYKKCMSKAVALGLVIEDFYIRIWASHLYPRAGVNRILSNPISGEELEIHSVIDEMRKQGHSWAQIQLKLERKNLIKKMHRQNFDVWLNRRDLKNLYPKNE